MPYLILLFSLTALSSCSVAVSDSGTDVLTGTWTQTKITGTFLYTSNLTTVSVYTPESSTFSSGYGRELTQSQTTGTGFGSVTYTFDDFGGMTYSLVNSAEKLTLTGSLIRNSDGTYEYSLKEGNKTVEQQWSVTWLNSTTVLATSTFCNDSGAGSVSYTLVRK